MLRVLSLGAGVQSTTLALMAKHGEIGPMPDCAIFANTGAEPGAVYAHLAWLTSSGVLPFPVHEVSAGNLRDILLDPKHRRREHARPPLYTIRAIDGKKGMLGRQCTGDFKIAPIEKKVRELIGLKPRQRWPKAIAVEQWLGISTDEASRMKPATIRVVRKGEQMRVPHPAIRVRWPLIEKFMSRRDCLAWLKKHGYPEPPKSACTFCPFRSNAEWRRIRDTDKEAWREAVMVDSSLREQGFRGVDASLFIHRSCTPLALADLSGSKGDPNLFENECEGVCGV